MVPTRAATPGVKGHQPVVGTRDCKHLLYVFAVVNLVTAAVHANALASPKDAKKTTGPGGAVEPGWLTSDVVALAGGIHDAKAADRLPILVDALQDAGYDNDEIRTHCRRTDRERVSGCWAIDLLLGGAWQEGDPAR